jgi:hypothetical protein
MVSVLLSPSTFPTSQPQAVHFVSLCFSDSNFLGLTNAVYHLHAFPVNSTGSCASALGHIDPFIRGETPPCNSSAPQTCQVGDLSGKHGAITSDPFSATWIDDYASIVPGLGSFFGNRSFVVHFANTTRITCANFAIVPGTALANSTATTTSSPAIFTGSAASVAASLVSVFGALTAALLL